VSLVAFVVNRYRAEAQPRATPIAEPLRQALELVADGGVAAAKA
jgi:hypothetical protein